MAGDEQEEEREFLAELKARSGQDLAQWMAAIAAQGFADKNETIDWLRAQGFAFARASWLERIHSNGGRPIYMDQPPKPAPEPKPVPPARAPSARETADLEKLLAAAKGYRPLYQLLEAEIRRAVPGVDVKPKVDLHRVCRAGRVRRRDGARRRAAARPRPWAIDPSMQRCSDPR